MQEEPHYRVSVVREGWSGGVDELAEVVALRFTQPTIRVRQELQRHGRFDVPGLGPLADAQRVVGELLAAGVNAVVVEVRLANEAAEGSDATFLALAGERTLRDGELVVSHDQTLVGMVRSERDDTFIAGRGPAVIPETDAAPEGAESLPEAWRAVVAPGERVGAGTPPPVPADASADAPTNQPPTSGPAPGPRAASAEAPADRGWSAVLGNVLKDRLIDAQPRPDDSATVVLPAEDAPFAARPQPPATGGGGPSPAPQLPVVPDEAVDDREPTRLMQPKPRGDGNPPVRERRYERLRPPPVDTASSTHSPLVAGLWSVLAPGAGQAYNGDLQRGISFAIGGLLVVPWFWSVIDAVLRAADLRARGRVPRSNPLGARLGLVGGFWVAATIVYLGASLVIASMTRDPVPMPSPSVTAPVEPRPVVRARPAADDGSAPEVEVEPAERLRMRQQEAAVLVLEAQTACGAGDFVNCRRLAEAALALDDRSRAAQRIHAQAIAGVFQTDDAPGPDEGSGAVDGSR